MPERLSEDVLPLTDLNQVVQKVEVVQGTLWGNEGELNDETKPSIQ